MEASCNDGGAIVFIMVVWLAFIVRGVGHGGIVIFQELPLPQSLFSNFVCSNFECGSVDGGSIIEWLPVLMIGSGTVTILPQGICVERSSPYVPLSPTTAVVIVVVESGGCKKI